MTDSQPVEFGGNCAFALSTGKKNVMGKENYFLIQNGKKYVFSNAVAKFLWRVIPGCQKRATSTWNS